jgi:hypothetical protein
MTPSIKKTYGGLRSEAKSGMNNALHFLSPSMKDYTGLQFRAVVGEKSPLHSKSPFKIAEGANRRRKLVLTPANDI